METFFERAYFYLGSVFICAIMLSVLSNYEFEVNKQDAESKLENSGKYIDCISLDCVDKILEEHEFVSFKNYLFLCKIQSTVSTLDTFASQTEHEECEYLEVATYGIPVVVKTHILSKKYIGLNSLRTRSSESGTEVWEIKSVNHILACKMIFILLTFVTVTTVFQKSKNVCQTVDSCKSIFQFGSQSVFEITVYPVSLEQHLGEIEKNEDKHSKHMNNEWVRYESFKTFPVKGPVSMIRLAQSGFYYSGKGVEVVCFFCGVRNDKWANNESVNDVHKRLSPNCKLINGEKTENAPINGSKRQNNNGGASGGPDDLPENKTLSTRQQTERRSESPRKRNEVSHNTELNYVEQTYTPTGSRNQNCQENERHSFIQNGNSVLYSAFKLTEEIKHYPGITNDRSKHPDYEIRSVRLSSFLQWPKGHATKPEDLAEAGFFFCEISDCVRCFSCGGGLKNWEYGDNPWIEHARWFPTCAYLKKCKGEDFVNQLRNLDSQQADIAEDQFIKDLNSIAAKRVFDMGYMQTQVEDAIRNIRQRIGFVEELKAQHLLEYLLDNSYGTSTTRATAAGQQSHTAQSTSRQLSSPSTHQPDKTNVSIDKNERISPERYEDRTTKTIKDGGEICHFCGGWMLDWKQDDAWFEHAKRFPNCDYIQLMIKQEHVDKGYTKKNVEQEFQRSSESQGRTKRSRQVSESLDFTDEKATKRVRTSSVSPVLSPSAACSTTSTFPEDISSSTTMTPLPVAKFEASVRQAASPVAPLTTIFSDNSQDHDPVLEENRKLKDKTTCKICFDKDACVVFLPCNHMLSCIDCARRQNACAVCRRKITNTIRVYPA